MMCWSAASETTERTPARATTRSSATCPRAAPSFPAPDLQAGDAVGEGNDLLVGGGDDDVITGDSFSPNGTAVGGGNDQIFGEDGLDRIAGDSNTKGGTAAGGGTTSSSAAGVESLVGDSHSIGHVGDVSGAGDDVLKGGPERKVSSATARGAARPGRVATMSSISDRMEGPSHR